MRVSITIIITIAATLLLMSSGRILPFINLHLHRNSFINNTLKYQLFAFCIAIAVLITTLVFTTQSRQFLNTGNLEMQAVKEKWLGINGKTNWRTNALQLALFISLATGIFMFIAVKHTGSLQNFQWSFISVILLLSLTNSFSEEIIYRFAIVGNLSGYAPKLTILLLSAVLFGLPHYFGAPGGFIGVIMSGLLGYILSKATYETAGLGIAWSIHFLQDVIIFTAIFMMNIKN